MAQKRFYWLKLKENFFEEDTISWLEEQENGKEYCLFYLKLCLKSLKTDGILIRNVGELLIPYDIKKLADMTNTDIDTARVSMEIFKKVGLIQILENGEIYLTQLENMVGSETTKAEPMRRLRAKRKEIGNNVTQSLPRERVRDKEKEIDIYKYIVEYLNQKTCKHFKYNSSKTKSLIKARLNEGYTEEDFIKVIDIKTNEWLKTKMEQYLRPETLFSNKFEGYLNQSSSSPSWFDKDIKKEEVSDKELEELQEMMRGY